jgi:hypothetical protein
MCRRPSRPPSPPNGRRSPRRPGTRPPPPSSSCAWPSQPGTRRMSLLTWHAAGRAVTTQAILLSAPLSCVSCRSRSHVLASAREGRSRSWAKRIRSAFWTMGLGVARDEDLEDPTEGGPGRRFVGLARRLGGLFQDRMDEAAAGPHSGGDPRLEASPPVQVTPEEDRSRRPELSRDSFRRQANLFTPPLEQATPELAIDHRPEGPSPRVTRWGGGVLVKGSGGECRQPLGSRS